MAVVDGTTPFKRVVLRVELVEEEVEERVYLCGVTGGGGDEFGAREGDGGVLDGEDEGSDAGVVAGWVAEGGGMSALGGF